MDTLGDSPAYKIGGSTERRYEAFEDFLDSNFDRVMKKPDFWYIYHVDVARTEQGKGIGRNLMDIAKGFVVSQEDRYNTRQICVECHDGNVAFYEKMGFLHYDRVLVAADDIKNEKPLHYNIMLWLPRGSESNPPPLI